MGRILIICRLAVRDLRHRPAEAVLLLLAITAATTTLTLGLILHGVTSHPYDQTRAATAGPDIVASVFPPGSASDVTQAQVTTLTALDHAPGVTAHSGPFPVTWAVLRANGLTAGAEVEGRDQAPAPVDQPKLTQGTWVRGGEVVVERTFADALGVKPGDVITLGGRSFRVAGIAVTAAFTPFPQICSDGCDLGLPQLTFDNTGMLWLTQGDARSLATSAEPLVYFLNLKLANPAQADAFVNSYDNKYVDSPSAPYLDSWQQISQQDGNLVMNEQLVLMVGSWLLGLLAVASVAVLVGGRMAEQMRRVGLLKAVGGTPGLVAAVLLAEDLTVALIGAAAGLVAGRLVAPLLTNPGAGLLGTAGAPPISTGTIEMVVAVAVAVAVAATLIPAIRAARTSTVRALADAARPPRRTAALIALSARLPVPLLLGLRLAARRPRRAVLTAFSVAITVSGIVAVLFVHARFDANVAGAASVGDPQVNQLSQVMLFLTIALATLAAVNAIFITQATVLDARHSSALTRALGATPEQVIAGLSIAQVLPALAGAILGIPGGIVLYLSVKHGATTTYPPIWWLAAVVVGSLVAAVLLTAIPAWLGTRHPAAEVLQSETA